MDLKLIEEGNGGDFVKTSKDLQIIEGLHNMPYLALFGGNPGFPTPIKRIENEQNFDWWGNGLFFANNRGLQFNSLTEKRLREVSLNSSGRLLIEEAIKKDLEFMQEFSEIMVSSSIVSSDRIEILIRVKELDNLQTKEFIFIWDSTKQELT